MKIPVNVKVHNRQQVQKLYSIFRGSIGQLASIIHDNDFEEDEYIFINENSECSHNYLIKTNPKYGVIDFEDFHASRDRTELESYKIKHEFLKEGSKLRRKKTGSGFKKGEIYTLEYVHVSNRHELFIAVKRGDGLIRPWCKFNNSVFEVVLEENNVDEMQTRLELIFSIIAKIVNQRKDELRRDIENEVIGTVEELLFNEVIKTIDSKSLSEMVFYLFSSFDFFTDPDNKELTKKFIFDNFNNPEDKMKVFTVGKEHFLRPQSTKFATFVVDEFIKIHKLDISSLKKSLSKTNELDDM